MQRIESNGLYILYYQYLFLSVDIVICVSLEAFFLCCNRVPLYVGEDARRLRFMGSVDVQQHRKLR